MPILLSRRIADMRLIDADKLKKEVESIDHTAWFTYEVLEVIDEQPTVEVDKCKN